MATTKVFSHLDYQNVNEIKNAILNPFADLTAMNAYSTAQSYGVAQEGIPAYNKDDNKLYFWTGTQWETADKDEEVLVLTADPFVTPPTVTTATNLGVLFVSGQTPQFYSYDQATSTWHLMGNTVNLGTATAPDLTMTDTTQFNDNGEVWIVDNAGTALLVSDGTDTYYDVRASFSVVAGTNTIDITDGLATKSNWRTGVVAIDKSLFRIQVSDSTGSVGIYECVDLTDISYSFNSNGALPGATVSAIYVGK